MKIEKDKLISEIQLELQRIRTLIPKGFDGEKLHRNSTIPSKLSNINYSLSFRYQHLGVDAIKLIKTDSFLASAILIRSLMETAALLWFVDYKIKKFLNTESLLLKDLDDFLMKIQLGSKEETDSYQAYNILTPIEKKENNQYKIIYQKLSEFTHPNFGGTAGYFSKHVSKSIKEFGENKMKIDPYYVLYPYAISIHLLTKSHNSIVNSISSLVSKLG